MSGGKRKPLASSWFEREILKLRVLNQLQCPTVYYKGKGERDARLEWFRIVVRHLHFLALGKGFFVGVEWAIFILFGPSC